MEIGLYASSSSFRSSVATRLRGQIRKKIPLLGTASTSIKSPAATVTLCVESEQVVLGSDTVQDNAVAVAFFLKLMV